MTTITVRTEFDLCASLYNQASKDFLENAASWRRIHAEAEGIKQQLDAIRASARLSPYAAEAKNEGDRDARVATYLSTGGQYSPLLRKYETLKAQESECKDKSDYLLQQIALYRRKMDWEIGMLKAMESE
jgi:hypothetical protein